MSARRQIRYWNDCDAAAERSGGYQRIDDSLNAVWDVLCNNPYQLPQIQSDWYNARYVLTKPSGDAPALVWVVTIDSNGDVQIEHVEEAEDY